MLVAYGNETKLPLYIIFQSKYIIDYLTTEGYWKKFLKIEMDHCLTKDYRYI